MVDNAKPRFSELKLERATGTPPLPACARPWPRCAQHRGEINVLDSRLQVVSQPPGTDNDTPIDYEAAREALVTDQQNHSLTGNVLVMALPCASAGACSPWRCIAACSWTRPSTRCSARSWRPPPSASSWRCCSGSVSAPGCCVAWSACATRRSTCSAGRSTPATRSTVAATRSATWPARSRSCSASSAARRPRGARSWPPPRTSCARRWPRSTGCSSCSRTTCAPRSLDLEDARERTAQAKEQTRRLSQLATDLLDLSRLDADLELRTEPLELGEICRAVAAEFELRAAMPRSSSTRRRRPDPSWVVADPGAVARVIRILLDNALRVSPPTSVIHVVLASTDTWATAAVRDEGPGVPEAERDLIFERFQRGSSAAGRTGFGLGLAIGRELADRMGGSLTLDIPRDGRAAPASRCVCRSPSAARTPSTAFPTTRERHRLRRRRAGDRRARPGRRADRRRHRIHGRGPLPHPALPHPDRRAPAGRR